MFASTSMPGLPTVAVAVALLFPGLGSAEAEDTVTVLEITVPALVDSGTATTMVKGAGLATANATVEQAIVPAAPTAGVVQLQPPGAATDTKLGKLRGVDVSPFQITPPNSTQVSDYGAYDTTTLKKQVEAVVNVTFGLG